MSICASAAGKKEVKNPSVPINQVITNVMTSAPLYESIVSEYEAELYIKGKLNIIKSNRLLRYVPSMFKLEKNVKEYFVESINNIHFTAPNIFDQQIKGIEGTIPTRKAISPWVLEYFYMNVYSSNLLHDKLLSPLSSDARKYYSYSLDSVFGSSDSLQYKISFIPKNQSHQLIRGYMVVSDQLWTVRQMVFEGQTQMIRFKVDILMGREKEEEFLPVRCAIELSFRFLWNAVDAGYTCYSSYKDVKLNNSHQPLERVRNKYDLSESFTLQTDNASVLMDSTTFAALRPVPLSEKESSIKRQYNLRRDTLITLFQPKSKQKVFWGEVGDVLLKSYKLDMAKIGSIKGSPLINPFLLNYSHNDGFSYRQDFKFNRLFEGDKLLRIVPRIGYNFKRNEFYWNVVSDFDYWPRKRAAFHLNFGNGNRIYSSDVLDALKQIPDTVLDFDQIHIGYYRDLFVDLNHSVEVINGLSISLGATAHRRTATEPSRFISDIPLTPDQIEMLANIRNKYISFAPRLVVKWTPGQYYYMSGRRKVNLHSNYPTFIVDYERGIKGVFGSTSEYERLEMDVQHHLELGLMRSISYRVGMGGFTNQGQLYFVDFANFTKRNLPVGWNDDIGGVFQLLDSRWYNSSDNYVRGHFVYESPFILFRHTRKYTGFILKERAYFSALYMKHLTPYIELGYGIGTNIFDAGVFVSSSSRGFGTVGFKFTFELFN